MKKRIAMILVLSMLLALTACGAEPEAETIWTSSDCIAEAPETEATEVLTPIEDEDPTIYELPTVPPAPAEIECHLPLADAQQNRQWNYGQFAAKLLQNVQSDGNTLISPLSVLTALSMAAEGAEGQTYTEIATAVGVSVEDMETLIRRFKDPSGENVTISNSIWLNDMEIRDEYREKITSEYHGVYQAEAFEEPFGPEIVTQVNAWVKEHTKERIERIVDTLDPSTKLLLINALTFDGEWMDAYTEHQISESDFTPENGVSHPVAMLNGSEHVYLENDLSTGFMKYYKGGRYAFAALLPNEGVTLDELVAQLAQEGVWGILENQTNTTVHTMLPKLDESFSTNLIPALQRMGVEIAFTPVADFSGITGPSNQLYIDMILHKTCLKLDENGTEAAAVTMIGMKATGMPNPDFKEVFLNRPFVYMIVDTDLNLPIFLGTIRDI